MASGRWRPSPWLARRTTGTAPGSGSGGSATTWPTCVTPQEWPATSICGSWRRWNMTAELILRDNLTRTPGGTLAADLPEALADTWAAIRQRNRSVPAARIVVASRTGTCGSAQWAALLPVLQVGTGLLTSTPSDVLGWLLHQAAHTLSDHDGPGTDEGRYHSAAFRRAASTVGLAAEARPAQPGIGFADLTLQPGTAQLYAAQLAELTEALSSWTPPASASARSRAAADDTHDPGD
jgi:hypothetical protein